MTELSGPPPDVASLSPVAPRTLAAEVEAFETHLRSFAIEFINSDDPHRAMNQMVTSVFVIGDRPAHRQADLGILKPAALPRRCRVVRQADTNWGAVRVVVGLGWVRLLRQRSTGETVAWISAVDDGSLTLAELYEAVGRAAIVAGGEPYINGTYL